VQPNRVELKLSIFGEEGAKYAKQQLGLEDRKATQATIWFCDEWRVDGNRVRFQLFDNGVIVRLRRKEGESSDTTVKYRRDEPFTLPQGWDPKTMPEIKLEGDWTTGGRKVAASIDASVADGTIREAGTTGPPLPSALFSDEQQRFAAALLAPKVTDLTTLRPLGPISALRWDEEQRDDLDNEVGAEQWQVDGLAFLELSIRVKYENADRWSHRFAEWAANDQHLDIASVGTTKTQAVLEHFARRPAL